MAPGVLHCCCCCCVPNGAARWTPATVAAYLLSAIVLCGIVFADVLVMLNVQAVARRVQPLVTSPGRTDAMLVQFSNAGNATVVAVCNTTVPADDATFVDCALGAYACVADLAANASGAWSPTGNTSTVAEGTTAAGADWTAYATATVGGPCLYSTTYDWAYVVDRLEWAAGALFTALVLAAVGLALGLLMRALARDHGRNYVLAETVLLRNLVIDLPVLLQYLAIVAVYGELCWECLAAPTCTACGSEATTAAVPSQLLVWFAVGLALRFTHLAELIVRMFFKRDRVAVSALAIVATVPVWLPVLAYLFVMTICLEPTGFIFRMTSGDGASGPDKVQTVGLPVAIAVCVISAAASIVVYWRLVVRTRNNGDGAAAKQARSTNGAATIIDDPESGSGDVLALEELSTAAGTPPPSTPPSPTKASPTKSHVRADSTSTTGSAESPTKLLGHWRNGRSITAPQPAALDNRGTRGEQRSPGKRSVTIDVPPLAARGSSSSGPSSTNVTSASGSASSAPTPPRPSAGQRSVTIDVPPMRGGSASAAAAPSSAPSSPPASPPKARSTQRLLDDHSPRGGGGSGGGASPASNRSISLDSSPTTGSPAGGPAPARAQRKLVF